MKVSSIPTNSVTTRNFTLLLEDREKESESVRHTEVGSILQENQDGDQAILSRKGVELAQEEQEKPEMLEEDEGELDHADQQKVRQMQSRDREVRQHEQAHMAAAGRISVSGPIYQTEQGPDGRIYVTEGKVNFRVPPAQSAQERLELAQHLRRMALAPASPSAKDRSVAAQATRKINIARQEIAEEKRNESQQKGAGTPMPSADFSLEVS